MHHRAYCPIWRHSFIQSGMRVWKSRSACQSQWQPARPASGSQRGQWQPARPVAASAASGSQRGQWQPARLACRRS
ncbi:unnamed protein product [Gadus morhua 'NCC']